MSSTSKCVVIYVNVYLCGYCAKNVFSYSKKRKKSKVITINMIFFFQLNLHRPHQANNTGHPLGPHLCPLGAHPHLLLDNRLPHQRGPWRPVWGLPLPLRGRDSSLPPHHSKVLLAPHHLQWVSLMHHPHPRPQHPLLLPLPRGLHLHPPWEEGPVGELCWSPLGMGPVWRRALPMRAEVPGETPETTCWTPSSRGRIWNTWVLRIL